MSGDKAVAVAVHVNVNVNDDDVDVDVDVVVDGVGDVNGLFRGSTLEHHPRNFRAAPPEKTPGGLCPMPAIPLFRPRLSPLRHIDASVLRNAARKSLNTPTGNEFLYNVIAPHLKNRVPPRLAHVVKPDGTVTPIKNLRNGSHQVTPLEEMGGDGALNFKLVGENRKAYIVMRRGDPSGEGIIIAGDGGPLADGSTHIPFQVGFFTRRAQLRQKAKAAAERAQSNPAPAPEAAKPTEPQPIGTVRLGEHQVPDAKSVSSFLSANPRAMQDGELPTWLTASVPEAGAKLKPAERAQAFSKTGVISNTAADPERGFPLRVFELKRRVQLGNQSYAPHELVGYQHLDAPDQLVVMRKNGQVFPGYNTRFKLVDLSALRGAESLDALASAIPAKPSLGQRSLVLLQKLTKYAAAAAPLLKVASIAVPALRPLALAAKVLKYVSVGGKIFSKVAATRR